MAEARRREHWAHTSEFLAMIYWAYKSKNAPAKSANDFNPYTPKARPLTMREAFPNA